MIKNVKSVAFFVSICVIGFALPDARADSKSWTSISDIPVSQCDLPNIANVIYGHDVMEEGTIAKFQLSNLAEMRAITDKAPKGDSRPLDELLSLNDRDRYNELRQKSISMNGRGLIESRRARDAKVINKLAQMADRMYRYDEQLSADHSDYPYQAIIELGRLVNDGNFSEVTQGNFDHCSYDVAIYGLQSGVLALVNGMSGVIEQSSKSLKSIAAKYKTKKIDPAALSPADKKAYQLAIAVVMPAVKGQQYLTDLEFIKLMAAASELIYTSDLYDMNVSGGDFSVVGTSISAKIESKEVDQKFAASIGIWRQGIDKKFPSEKFKEIEATAKIIDEANKIYPVKPAQ